MYAAISPRTMADIIEPLVRLTLFCSQGFLLVMVASLRWLLIVIFYRIGTGFV